MPQFHVIIIRVTCSIVRDKLGEEALSMDLFILIYKVNIIYNDYLKNSQCIVYLAQFLLHLTKHYYFC